MGEKELILRKKMIERAIIKRFKTLNLEAEVVENGCYYRARRMASIIKRTHPSWIVELKKLISGDGAKLYPMIPEAEFWHHWICIGGGTVWDPLFGAVVSEEDYLARNFPNQTVRVSEKEFYS